jgi:L-aminopeptidase/D-esterase-like protein
VLGFESAIRTGLGSAAGEIGGATVAAIAVPNPALGDVWSLSGDRVVAGHGLEMSEIARRARGFDRRENTTLVVVATDARLAKSHCAALAVSAHAGIARVIRPSHTPYDGDSAFVLTTGTGPEVGLDALSVIVQDVVSRAIVDAARAGAAS